MNEVDALLQAILSSPKPAPEKQHTSDGQQALKLREGAVLALKAHPDDRLRQQAAELLGEHLNEAACEALLELARDPAAEVRQQAFTSLEAFKQPEVAEALKGGLQDPDYVVRATAAEVLGSFPPESSVEALINALKDPYYMVRATAAEALGCLEAVLAVPALQDLLLDGDQWVRYSAAESLNQIEPDEQIWQLLMDLNSIDQTAQTTALKALGDLADRRALPTLIRLFKDLPEQQELILRVMERFHDPLVVPALIEVALFTDQPHLREMALIQAQQQNLPATLEALASWLDPDKLDYAQQAVELLHQLPSQQSTPLFKSALQLPDRWVRTVAMLALDARHEKVERKVLSALLKEPAPDLVHAVLHNFLSFYPEAIGKHLNEFLNSSQTWRRQALAENLHLLPTAELQASSAQLLQDPESDVRETTLRSLAKRPASESQQALLTGSQDSDPWVRKAALEGLAQQHTPEAASCLCSHLLNDDDFMVRSTAAEALETQPGEGVNDVLLQALGDPMASVRQQVSRSLFARKIALSAEQYQQLLQDEDKTVVLGVLSELQKTPQPDLQPALKELSVHEDPQLQAAASQALQTLDKL